MSEAEIAYSEGRLQGTNDGQRGMPSGFAECLRDTFFPFVVRADNRLAKTAYDVEYLVSPIWQKAGQGDASKHFLKKSSLNPSRYGLQIC